MVYILYIVIEDLDMALADRRTGATGDRTSGAAGGLRIRTGPPLARRTAIAGGGGTSDDETGAHRRRHRCGATRKGKKPKKRRKGSKKTAVEKVLRICVDALRITNRPVIASRIRSRSGEPSRQGPWRLCWLAAGIGLFAGFPLPAHTDNRQPEAETATQPRTDVVHPRPARSPPFPRSLPSSARTAASSCRTHC